MNQKKPKGLKWYHKPHLTTGNLQKRLWRFVVRESKLITTIILLTTLSTPVILAAQEVSISVKNASLDRVLKDIGKQSGYSFFVNADVLKISRPINIQFRNQPLRTVLDEIFDDQPLDYEIQGKSIVVRPKKVNSRPIFSSVEVKELQQDVIGGRVTSDSLGNYIAGATIKALPSGNTVMSDEKGIFRLTLEPGDNKIAVSYLGMQNTVIAIGSQNFIEVRMKSAAVSMDDIVVTGLFNKSKETFTAASQSFSGEELQALASTNVIEALSMLTPGLVAPVQNREGSNPNNLPDLLVRGVTSFTNTDQSVNQPLIVRDGTIVTLQDL